MDVPRDPARLDWLVELGGAAAPAAAAGFAGLKLAPMLSMTAGAAMGIASVTAFALAYLAMLRVEPEPRHHVLAAFTVAPIEPLSELLLEERYEQPDELLLDDVIAEPDPNSRVVNLFTPEASMTAGQLMTRIDRHLADAAGALPAQDASDALYQALADLRRSLR